MIGQALLIAPVIIGLAITTLQGVGPGVHDTALGLGASPCGRPWWWSSRRGTPGPPSCSWPSGGRSPRSGVAMMVGGNIRGYTRTLTTAISLGVGRGDTAEAVALGIILLVVALAVTVLATAAGRLSRGA